ncbi:MAG: hypothetical protein HWN68_02660 [Desulfobacterales bacterium]|nr:hypothetical protein [Desulfobacterales bacterium]
MGQKLDQITEILIRRLEKKGIEGIAIPGFMRDLANIISHTPHMELPEVNRKLHSLGWSDFELDDHTLQLAIASLELKGSMASGDRSAYWFNSTFKQNLPGAIGR